MLDKDIIAACRRHGAKALHDASIAAMDGRHAAMQALGFGRLRIGELNSIMSAAYKLMSDEDQTADLTQASIKAAAIMTPSGARKPPDDYDDEPPAC